MAGFDYEKRLHVDSMKLKRVSGLFGLFGMRPTSLPMPHSLLLALYTLQGHAMTRPIDALPAELLSQIFEQACEMPRPRRSPRCSPADRANLCNFSLVHSHWRQPAQALSLACVTVKITAMHNGAVDLQRLCERNPDFASCIRSLRIHQFSATAISSDGETLQACQAIATACSKMRHLKLKVLSSSFQDLLSFPSSEQYYPLWTHSPADAYSCPQVTSSRSNSKRREANTAPSFNPSRKRPICPPNVGISQPTRTPLYIFAQSRNDIAQSRLPRRAHSGRHSRR